MSDTVRGFLDGRTRVTLLILTINLVLVGIALVAHPLRGTATSEASPPPEFTDTPLASITEPMDLAWTPDGRMLITTKPGRLRIYSNGSLIPGPALDLSAVLCAQNERALAGVAVHPSFAQNHYVYLYYTFKKFGTCNESETNGPVNRLSRFTLADSNTVDPASEAVLFDTPPLPTNFHNAGDVEFGRDGYVYVTVGDGGTACCTIHPGWPRDPGVLFGKVLRVTDSGDIPSSNPFTGPGTARCNLNGVPPEGSSPGTKCQEVYAVGLRNPFIFAFDLNSPTVRFFVNDVGENDWEEVDLGQASADYGWPVREGPCAIGSTTDCGPPPNGVTNPIYWYGHNVTVGGSPCVSITAAAFVPNGFWPTAYDNSYFFADFICGQIWMLKPDGLGGYTASAFGTVEPAGPVSMRFGPYGTTQALYYLNRALGGQLRRISFTGDPPQATLARNFRVDWSDHNNDGRVTILDISQAAFLFGRPNRYWDYNLDGAVTILDIAIIAFYFGQTFNTNPWPGQGQSAEAMDPSWRSQCSLLPPQDQNYCNNLP